MKSLEGLTTTRLGRRFLWLDEVSSTNNYIKEHMDSLPDGFTVAAGYQSAGRGTRARVWDARPNSSLMFSLLLHGLPPDRTAFLPLLAGLAVCEAVADVTGHTAGIKWPNDVVALGKKLCGILCESRHGPGGVSAVIGIGVNLTQTPEELMRLNLVYAASLQSVSGKEVAPLPLACAILNRLEPLLDETLRDGFSEALRLRYKGVSVTVGREARFLQNGEEMTAFVRDIAEDGSLLVERDGVCTRLYAGDVSVRGLYGYADHIGNSYGIR